MKAAEALSEPVAKASDIGWACRSMALSWRSSKADDDAARLFVQAFGCEATRVHRNKFPTASMPCRSWASGQSEGIGIDVRIGVDDAYSQIRLFGRAESVLMRSDLAQFRSCIDRIEAAASFSLADCHAMLDLELPDKTDYEAFMHWLGHEDWQGRALLLNLECVFVPAGGKTEVSVTASFDRRSGQLGLAVGVAAPAGRNHLVSSQIFDALDGLLATERLANIAAL